MTIEDDLKKAEAAAQTEAAKVKVLAVSTTGWVKAHHVILIALGCLVVGAILGHFL